MAKPDPQSLLAWYDAHARKLPWRVPPRARKRADPYRVWLCEVMLQQTTVTAVAPYYARFLARWPTIEALALAPLEDVLAGWAGLGYYARARALHACAREIVEQHGGHFPSDVAGLLALPGIGPYTAGAIAAIAFGRPVAAIDGNAERVIARVFAVTAPLPAAKGALNALAQALVPRDRPGDFAQSLMDLGATICTVKRPACALCPWAECCRARALGIAGSLPVKAPKRERATRRGAAFVLTRADGKLLLQRRPAKGLLGGMLEVPSTPWEEDRLPARAAALARAPSFARWRKRAGLVAHKFTHFHLELEVYSGRTNDPPADGIWADPLCLDGLALPSLMRKVIAAGLGKSAQRPHPQQPRANREASSRTRRSTPGSARSAARAQAP
jgi:A/G-specific adenine glycosylase